jgi:hypothetical protein
MSKTLVAFRVLVVDGEGIPVADLGLGARFRYKSEPTTWSHATTDGDGYASFCDEHPETPEHVCFFIGEELCDVWADVVTGQCFVLEL